MAIAIAIDNVSRRFGEVQAVDDLSFEIAAGEFFTLLGSSGSGKSSLLKMIGGFDRPDQGRILFDGKDMAGIPANLRPVNTVFQGLGLFPHMSVAQNVGYGLKLKGLGRQALQARVDDALELVDLAGFGNRDVNLLSGGQRQRVALARALVMEPGILLLDEPLTGLDERLRQQMRDEFGRLHKRTGATFVLVTHNQDEALSLSDRMAIMHKGRIEQIDRPEQFFKNPANAFVARFVGMDNILTPERIETAGDGGVRAIVAGQPIDITPGLSATPKDRAQIVLRADRMVWPALDVPGRTLKLAVKTTAFRGLSRDISLAFADGQTVTMTLSGDAPAFATGQEIEIALKPEAALLTGEQAVS
ncbi:ABC transporter ATP-binding protein [Allorhizobium sp. BGMRC 0089]|uniref:ABC transporter ATP-binding protein n=1 Tax=Allorhizobium sonneratiae TaxID=2934936 RepID=UPI00203403B7|nr:ABC transporter ATP-binding protein [Allorhizobium sonneratiae]MCM2294088.1 ABC transporter ATP-binding protein [Allorhizobium sonneratiae]